MRKTYKWVCDFCGEEYEITSSQYHRLEDGRQKKGFCSIECKSRSQQRRVIRHCSYCNKEIERTEYQSSIKENVFCSKECNSRYLYETTHETRKCKICGKEYVTEKISSQRFCTPACANEYQKTRVGKLNANYHRVEVKCDWCGEPFDIQKYKVMQDHHFCGKECQREWYAKDFSQREDFKNLMRTKILKQFERGEIGKLDSKPQIIVNQLLDNNNIKYQREYSVGFYAVDNFLSENNLMIEVQGDYYHANPLKYDSEQLNSLQVGRVGKDKAKHTFIRNKYNIEVLYLWEWDIYNRADVCEMLINEYISHKGNLSNYHSFNYHIENGKLKLNDDIVIPFQERKIEHSKIRNDCDGLCGNTSA